MHAEEIFERVDVEDHWTREGLCFPEFSYGFAVLKEVELFSCYGDSGRGEFSSI